MKWVTVKVLKRQILTRKNQSLWMKTNHLSLNHKVLLQLGKKRSNRWKSRWSVLRNSLNVGDMMKMAGDMRVLVCWVSEEWKAMKKQC